MSSPPTLSAATPGPTLAQRGAANPPPEAAPRPFLTGTRPVGSSRAYERLAEALEAYRATRERSDYVALRNAADACGRPDGEPPMAWAAFEINKLKGMNL